MRLIQKAQEEVKETRQEFYMQTVTLLNGAFAFIAALAWNEAVKALIDSYFPSGSGLYSRFTYAIILTLLVVLISSRLNMLSKKFSKEKTNETNSKKN